jgi:uncharacterized protein (DUF2252 family)
MKQARPSSVLPYITTQQLQWESEAARVIGVQQRMQNVPAALLSKTIFRGEPYILQELQPVKDAIKFKRLKDNYRDMYQVIDDMAALTASAQLRSGGIQGSAIIDELMAFGLDQAWQEKVAVYAQQYAAKVAGYYRSYLKDYQKGRFETQE